MVANDRAQLVLVGAVVIAFIVVGIVVVFNGVVFTESVGDQGTVIDTKEGGSVGFGAERNIGETAHAVNTADKYDTAPETELQDRVEDSSPYISTAEAESGGNLVSIEYDDIIEEGRRLYQPETGNFTQENDSSDSPWAPVTGPTEFDRFAISINVEESQPDTLTVVNDDTGTGSDLFIETTSSDEVDLSGTVVSGDCAGIEPAGGGDDDFVTIQFNRGFVLDQPDCRIDPTYLDGIENSGLWFDPGQGDIKGTWDIVIEDETAFSGPDYDTSSSETGDEPNASTIIWSAEYRITYDAGQVETAFENEVDHYG